MNIICRVLLFALALLTTQVKASYILLLGDDYSETIIAPYLTNNGHQVTIDGIYYEWDGDIPSETEVIIYLNGYDYGYDLGEYGDALAANNAILDFVAGGGGLIFTEWYAYDEKTEPVDALMPVTYNGDYYYQASWYVSAGQHNHFLLEDLLSTEFVEGDGSEDTYSDVVTRSGTHVVMDDGNGIPLLSYTDQHGGKVIHINDGMSYDDEISNEILSIINRSVMYAAQPPISVTEPPVIIFIGTALFLLIIRKKINIQC